MNPTLTGGTGEARNGQWDKRRKQAWLNDALLLLDLKLGFTIRTRSDSQLQMLVSTFASNEKLKEYWLTLGDTTHLVQPAGSSASSYGTAFECSYSGMFREKYLEWVFQDKQIVDEILEAIGQPKLSIV